MSLDSINIYIFGSFVNSESPNDIDILIVYKANCIKIKSVIRLRNNIRNKVGNVSPLPLDITLLNEQEEQETNFILMERAIELPLRE